MPDVLLQLEQVSIIGCSIYYQLLLLLEKLQVLYVSGKGEVNQWLKGGYLALSSLCVYMCLSIWEKSN